MNQIEVRNVEKSFKDTKARTRRIAYYTTSANL